MVQIAAPAGTPAAIVQRLNSKINRALGTEKLKARPELGAQANWFWQRVVQHGRRRAEEMREAAGTVRDVRCEPHAEVRAWVATLDGGHVRGGWRDGRMARARRLHKAAGARLRSVRCVS